ncbi:MAG TPA: DNA polymerase III subunit delta' [Microbacteriaceae bacterium]|nr:DNA polymerase III subunit delta' [Microbacteriaceae bacterium]
MGYWQEVASQPQAIEILESATKNASELSHAWLITGPPGSGRSNIAYLFAAALIARSTQERELTYKQVVGRTHPDLDVLTTEGSIIKIDDARRVATRAHYAPSIGRYRVIIAEDADRLPEKSSNTLLKALEEPPERTIWILCAPSEADMLPTIRSRTRSLRLQTPSVSDVAGLLIKRDGVEEELAERVARLSQSHIGMARKLAKDPEALERRTRTLELVLDIRSLSDAMFAALKISKLAEADAKQLSEDKDGFEREEALRMLGVAPGGSVPPKLRGQIRALEDDQKRRAKRGVKDALDRVLTDVLSLYRDAILIKLNAQTALINEEMRQKLTLLADSVPEEGLLKMITAVETARDRLQRGVTPALTIEALFASVVAVGDGGVR